MKKSTTTLIILVLSLAAAGCSRVQTPDAVLQKIHERFIAQVTEAAAKLNVAAISETDTKIIAKLNEIPNLFAGSVEAEIDTTQSYDMTNEDNPLMKLAGTADINAMIPGTFLRIPTEDPQQALPVSIQLDAEGITEGRQVFARILDTVISIPGKPEIRLGEDIKEKWYGDTFEVIDRMIAERSADSNQESATVQQMLTESYRRQKQMPELLVGLATRINIWNGIETLPVENGLARVKVESDKEKIRQSLDSIFEFLSVANNPLNVPNIKLQDQLQETRARIESEFLAGSSAIRGIIKADLSTYDFRGFEGEIMDGNGEIALTVNYLNLGGDITLEIRNPLDESKNLDFRKTGEKFSLDVGGKPIASGTVTAEKFTLEAKDDTGIQLITVDFDIAESEPEVFKAAGTIRIPPAAVDINISELDISMSNSYKDMDFVFRSAAMFTGREVFELSIDTRRKEMQSLEIASPAEHRPFDAFMDDLQPFITSVMQGSQP